MQAAVMLPFGLSQEQGAGGPQGGTAELPGMYGGAQMAPMRTIAGRLGGVADSGDGQPLQNVSVHQYYEKQQPPMQYAEYPPQQHVMTTGWVPCDVLPNKMSTVHDVWSGANFCEEVAEMLRAHAASKYFSQGVTEPKPHMMGALGLRRERDVNAGIGIALERSELSGVVSVKRISAEGSAAADGRLRPGDVILSVDGVQIAGIGQEVASLIIGPEGTYVELSVEHSSGERDMIRIKRGSAVHADNVLPYSTYKSYAELPYYLSESDRDKALAETSELVAEMRKKFLANPDTNQHSSIIDRASGSAMYGVAPMAPKPSQGPSILPVTKPSAPESVAPAPITAANPEETSEGELSTSPVEGADDDNTVSRGGKKKKKKK